MKRVKMIAMMLVCALFATSCGSTKTEVAEDAVIMQIDGEDVMKSEYMVYLYTTTQSFLSLGGEEVWTMEFDGLTADDVVEERTLDTLRKVKATTKYAQENAIVMSEEEIATAEASATEFMAAIPAEDIAQMGVTEETMAELMKESYLFGLVYQEIAAAYVVDEAEKEAYFAANMELYREEYTYLDFDCIVLDDMAVAEEVLAKAKAGEDFEALFDEYDIDEAAKETEEKGKASILKSNFLASFGMSELPGVGLQDEVMVIDEYYFVMNIENITVPTDDECNYLMESAYAQEAMYAYAEEETQNMITEQEVIYMEDVFATVTAFHD